MAKASTWAAAAKASTTPPTENTEEKSTEPVELASGDFTVELAEDGENIILTLPEDVVFSLTFDVAEELSGKLNEANGNVDTGGDEKDAKK